MNPGVKLLANKSFGFSLYDFHLEGVSAKELAAAYSLPTGSSAEAGTLTAACIRNGTSAAMQIQAMVCSTEVYNCATMLWLVPNRFLRRRQPGAPARASTV